MKTPHIHNNLKEYRKKANLKQTEVARLLGFTTSERISRWEKGKSYPSVLNLFKLAEIYGVFPYVLYKEQEIPEEQ
jgi:transcriptional regulator with XRE-family HTH domain